MRIRGVTYTANQLEKAVRLLAEEYDLQVDMTACVPCVSKHTQRPAKYGCTLTETKFRGDVKYIGHGDSMFKALRKAVENYFLGESQS